MTVQACHAVAEYLLFNKTEWTNGRMVILGVDGEDQLVNWYTLLKNKGVKVVQFREPPMDNQVTAICCVLDLQEGKLLQGLPLV